MDDGLTDRLDLAVIAMRIEELEAAEDRQRYTLCTRDGTLTAAGEELARLRALQAAERTRGGR